MKNERITEDIVRDAFKGDELFKTNKVTIEEQQSNNPRIQKLLKTASKSGGGAGKPEFIVTFVSPTSDFLIIVECKSDISKHESLQRDKYKDYAVDGVLLYSDYLAKEFDVISIAVSGQQKDKLKISNFLQLRKQKAKRLSTQEILSLESYLALYLYDEEKEKQSFGALLKYSRELNNYLRDIDLSEGHRPLLVSGILIALQDPAFLSSYKSEIRPSDLATNLFATISKVLDQNNITGTKKVNIIQSYGFIQAHSKLADDKDSKNTTLKDLISEINDKVNSFTKTYKYYDVLGKFYSEFLRYANGDKTLGIILTPQHITELFADLAGVNENSVVLDNCCGTAGFLIRAMQTMVQLCNKDKLKEKRVYNSLVGIESNSNMFALACSNMMIRGDGKSNIYYGDCFYLTDEIKKSHKPNVGLLNPPYAKKKQGQRELAFVLNNLECLDANSICIAIVPMSCAIDDPLKEFILSKHTLEAVMSMPENLFHDSKSGTVSCVMVIRAHVPHAQSDKKTWFAYWRNDGFVLKRREGRVDSNDTWKIIKEHWVEMYKNRESIEGLSLTRKVTAKDEWCIEAYLETKYTNISDQEFRKTALEYLSFLALNADFSGVNEFVNCPHDTVKLNLGSISWSHFSIGKLFTVKRGINITTQNNGLNGGTMVISANTNNNGFSHFLDRDPLYGGNVITIGNTGQSSVGVAFYQPYPFIATNNVNVLEPNFSLNQYIGIFIVSILKRERYKYSFGRVLDTRRTENLRINLPVDQSGKPDWLFMENYVKSLELKT